MQSLTIVIPALNEEEAVGGTIQRCLDARDEIKRAAGLADVHVVVVSDGSTDRTVEIAQGFDEIQVVVFEENQGYGAAIKEGFRQTDDELVGFLDADGTCDPRYFADLCSAVVKDGADVALGSRLGKDSKMPPVRRLGNRIFALLLGLFCGRLITDTASGMRVIRRSSLSALYPLPDGLHFTPAMSARALLNGLKVIETPMSYAERLGRSKLSVVRDGVRFAKTIFQAVLCYRPERIFLLLFGLCLLITLIVAARPVQYYFQHRQVLEWMVYRFLLCLLLGEAGLLFLSSAALAHRLAELGPRRTGGPPLWDRVVATAFRGRWLIVVIAIAVVLSLVLVWPGLVEYATTGHVQMHWSRAVVSAFGLLLALHCSVTAILLQVLKIWRAELPDGRREEPE